MINRLIKYIIVVEWNYRLYLYFCKIHSINHLNRLQWCVLCIITICLIKYFFKMNTVFYGNISWERK